LKNLLKKSFRKSESLDISQKATIIGLNKPINPNIRSYVTNVSRGKPEYSWNNYR